MLEYRAPDSQGAGGNGSIVLNELAESLYRASLYMLYYKGADALKELDNAESNATQALGAFIDLVRFMADIARINGSNITAPTPAVHIALVLKAYSIHQIDVCLTRGPVEAFRVLDNDYVRSVIDKMAENPYSVTVDQAMMVLTYTVGVPQLAKAYKSITGYDEDVDASSLLRQLNITIFKIPMCLGDLTGLDDPRLRTEWYRIPCISSLYTSKLGILTSLLAARPLDPGYREWMFPLPSPSLYNLSQLIPLLDTLSRISELLGGLNVSITVETGGGGSVGNTDIELNRTPAIDPTEVDKSLRDILREIGAGNSSSPLGRVIDATSMTEDRVRRVDLNERLGALSRIRLEDFKKILESLTTARAALLNSTLKLPPAAPNSTRMIQAPREGITVNVPRLPINTITPLFLVTLIAFASYMARDYLKIPADYIAGRLKSRLGRRRPGEEAALCYSKLIDALDTLGYGKRPSETPREYLSRMRSLLEPEIARGLESATRAYEAYKYAEAEPDPGDLGQCWSTIRRVASPWRYLRR
ncbi:MAG: DUF4129 domain-containing protein [Desulfurococcales archaeon]|nr:DUF4129 domain-containing protein [Desulfurococcales archaeon]